MRSKVIIIVAAVAFLASVIVAGVYDSNRMSDVSETEETEISDLVYCTETEEIEDHASVIENYENVLKDAKYITVEKVIRTIVEDNEGGCETSYEGLSTKVCKFLFPHLSVA